MRIDGRRYRDEWLPNMYPGRRVGDGVVRVSRAGRAMVLTPTEDAEIDSFFMSTDVFDRLERTGLILTPSNAHKAFDSLSVWLRGTYDGPGLHIVVTTRRCNLNCTYCHMLPTPVESTKSTMDMQPETVEAVVDFILRTPRKGLTIEFQGGEPFLNFAAVRQTVAEVRRRVSGTDRKVRFAIVSNLMVASNEDLEFCAENGVSVSYTLNGPEHVHDMFRVTRRGTGSYAVVERRLREIKERFKTLLSSYPLCVITKESAPYLIETIRHYQSLGFRNVGIIWLKHLGNTRGQLRFNMEDGLPYYLEALDFLYEQNKAAGPGMTERLVELALWKLIAPTNPGYIDWRNPIGYLSNCIVYDVDGEVLPVDEARSLRERFSLGNVRSTSYDDIIRRDESFETVNLSIRDRHPVCRNCAYNPYCGVSPVLQYAKTGSVEPEPHVNDECKFVLAVFDWIFKKVMADPVPLLKMAPRQVHEMVARAAESRRPDVMAAGRL